MSNDLVNVLPDITCGELAKIREKEAEPTSELLKCILEDIVISNLNGYTKDRGILPRLKSKYLRVTPRQINQLVSELRRRGITWDTLSDTLEWD